MTFCDNENNQKVQRQNVGYVKVVVFCAPPNYRSQPSEATYNQFSLKRQTQISFVYIKKMVFLAEAIPALSQGQMSNIWLMAHFQKKVNKRQIKKVCHSVNGECTTWDKKQLFLCRLLIYK